jgi:hypothetical protein
MAREDVRSLDTGDPFPELSFDTVGGTRLSLPGDFVGRWSIFLVYRGHF